MSIAVIIPNSASQQDIRAAVGVKLRTGDYLDQARVHFAGLTGLAPPLSPGVILGTMPRQDGLNALSKPCLGSMEIGGFSNATPAVLFHEYFHIATEKVFRSLYAEPVSLANFLKAGDGDARYYAFLHAYTNGARFPYERQMELPERIRESRAHLLFYSINEAGALIFGEGTAQSAAQNAKPGVWSASEVMRAMAGAKDAADFLSKVNLLKAPFRDALFDPSIVYMDQDSFGARHYATQAGLALALCEYARQDFDLGRTVRSLLRPPQAVLMDLQSAGLYWGNVNLDRCIALVRGEEKTVAGLYRK